MVSTWEKICDYPGRDEEEFDFQQAEQYSDGAMERTLTKPNSRQFAASKLAAGRIG